jgi:hypothetical protein
VTYEQYMGSRHSWYAHGLNSLHSLPTFKKWWIQMRRLKIGDEVECRGMSCDVIGISDDLDYYFLRSKDDNFDFEAHIEEINLVS